MSVDKHGGGIYSSIIKEREQQYLHVYLISNNTIARNVFQPRTTKKIDMFQAYTWRAKA